MAAAQAKDGGVPTWATLYTKNLPGNAKKVHTVGWSCDGAKVASGSQDKKIRVWSVDSKVRLISLVSLVGFTLTPP